MVNPITWLYDNFTELRTLVGMVDNLKTVVNNPLTYLRQAIYPAIIGSLLYFTNLLANSFAAPFEAIQTGLEALGSSLAGPFVGFLDPGPIATELFTVYPSSDGGFAPVGGIAQAVFAVVGLIETTVETATDPLGPLQPFGVAALLLVAGYVGLLITLRAGRAVLDSVPGLSGIETFLFG